MSVSKQRINNKMAAMTEETQKNFKRVFINNLNTYSSKYIAKVIRLHHGRRVNITSLRYNMFICVKDLISFPALFSF